MNYKFKDEHFIQGHDDMDVDEQINKWLAEEFQDKIIVSHSIRSVGYSTEITVIYTNKEEL